MNEDVSLKVLETYVEIDKIHDEINNKMFNFITMASEFVDTSEDDYQIEKTTELNKISLKDYVLNSPCCIKLKEVNVSSYTIDELKQYLDQYANEYNEDVSKYYRAIEIYEFIESIEDLVDKKVEMEINEINYFNHNINKTLELENKDDYEKLYIESKDIIDNDFTNNKINEKAHTIIIQMLNDIFNYFISGYPQIDDEYLYKIDLVDNVE